MGIIEKNIELSHDLEVATAEANSESDGVCVVDLVAQIDNKHVHKVDFCVDHAGFTLLRYAGIKDPVSPFFHSPTLPPDSPCADARIELSKKTFCRQAFYYIKYLLHKHAHHDPSNDSLTTTHRYKGWNTETARALIHDMKSGLVDIKRAARQETVDFAGIATYGKSLVTSCYAKGFFASEAEEKKIYRAQLSYFDNLVASISLLQKRSKPLRENRRQRLAVTQQILAILFLFITPIILVGRYSVDPSEHSLNENHVLEGQSMDPGFLAFLDSLASRLGTGDVDLLLKAYVLVFTVAVFLHLNFIDKIDKSVLGRWRRLFSFLRIRAFSHATCREGWYLSLAWYFHSALVKLRRWVRGVAYREIGLAKQVVFLVGTAGIIGFGWIAVERSLSYFF